MLVVIIFYDYYEILMVHCDTYRYLDILYNLVDKVGRHLMPGFSCMDGTHPLQFMTSSNHKTL